MSQRKIKRVRLIAAKKLFKIPKGDCLSIDLESVNHPAWMTRAFKNNRYVVMIDDYAETTKGLAIKAMIQRHDGSKIPNHWSELQSIKNELFGDDSIGIEYFPKQTSVVDYHNIYWLWIFKEDVLPIPINP